MTINKPRGAGHDTARAKRVTRKRPIVQSLRYLHPSFMAPPSALSAPEPGRPDGRRQRAERTRVRIINAMMELVAATGSQPTFAAVAERAGVNIRSVFVHFPDIESLVRTGLEMLRQQMVTLTEDISPADPLAKRLAEFVAFRARFFASMRSIWRVGWILSQGFAHVLANRAAYRAADRARLATLFAQELDRFPPRERPQRLDVLAGLIDWHFWEALIEGQNLPPEDAAQRLGVAMAAVLAPPH